MTRRIAFLLFLTLATCGAAFAEESSAADSGKSLGVRTFTFKHKDPDKAAAAIKSLMSADGSVSIQPSTSSIVVTDRAENLKAIAIALDKFDAPPQAFRISIRLVGATRGESAQVPAELKDVAALMMGRYNAFEALGNVTAEAHEGDPGIVEMEGGYRGDFHLGEYDSASDTIRINDLKLARLGAQKDQLTQLLKTSLNLKIGQTYMIGATKSAQSTKALLLVVTAKR